MTRGLWLRFGGLPGSARQVHRREKIADFVGGAIGGVRAVDGVVLDVSGVELADGPRGGVAGLVAPMTSRRREITFSPSKTITSARPELMNVVRLSKNGLPRCTA